MGDKDSSESSPSAFSNLSAIAARNVTDATGRVVIETIPYDVARFHYGAWIGMSILALVLLTLCALLAGLTLGVCGLDMTLLHLRCATGTPRERGQARIVARMKRNGTWMLCSLIICSVACGETFPFIISTLYHGPQIWIPILISTGFMAVFAEILPQYFIPRQAISWGYYCWPLIWGCMWLTAIVSYPLAWSMDQFASKSQKDEYGIFSNDDLATLIKYHQRSQKNGGKVGQDTTRIMLGALDLDSRKIGGEVHLIPPSNLKQSERDAEKADLVIVQSMIVKWPMVKTISINEKVDKAFIKKVRMWSYSRIPVTEESEGEENQHYTESTDWNGTKIFGYLHIKNLIGVDLGSKRRDNIPLLVKDLPLYPLPIVKDDMPVYELLNMFQLGMSRIAMVVPATPKGPQKVLNDSRDFRSTRWTGTDRTNNRIKSKLKASKANFDWTVDFLQAAHLNADDSLLQRHRIFGIRSPKPVGIITFEDIIDTILQKTSRDENDFFDRNTSTPPTKGKKAGDYSPRLVIGGVAPNSAIPIKHSKGHTSSVKPKQYNQLRKRKHSVNENPANLDGADERSQENQGIGNIKQQRKRGGFVDSSYTENSRGGFHNANRSDNSIYPAVMLSMLTSEDLAELANTTSANYLGNPYSPCKSASLPSRSRRPLEPKAQENSMRHVSAAPVLSRVRRITPVSRNTTSYEISEEARQAASELVIPAPSMAPLPAPSSPQPSFDHDASVIDIEDEIWREHFARGPENRSDLISLNSFDGGPEDDEGISMLYNAFPVPANQRQRQDCSLFNDLTTIGEEGMKRPYGGFPSELLEAKDESRISNYDSKTMPRMGGSSEQGAPVREESFHDDRSMLPSQSKVVFGEGVVVGARSSSLWW